MKRKIKQRLVENIVKSYQYVKAENSDVFKLLYSYSLLISDINGLCFKLNKNGSFVNDRINNCEIKIESREFKGFEGLVLLIVDHVKKEIVTSKYIKGVFSCNNEKKGMYDVEFTLRGFDYTIPYDSYDGCFSAGFNITNLPPQIEKKENFGFDFILNTDNIYFGIFGNNRSDSEEFLRNKKYKNKIKSRFKKQYSKVWDEELNYIKSPYLIAFNGGLNL